jgi:hypothetical protein
MHTVEALGIVWTLETFKTPKKFLRPCCVSTLYCNIPIIQTCIREKNYLLLLHATSLTITSILHHSNHNLGSVIHTVDKVNAYAFTSHIGIIAHDKVLYCKYLTGVIFCYLTTLNLKTSHEDINRDYDTILPLIPHVLLHSIMSNGVTSSVF